jgi:hypothetical protein
MAEAGDVQLINAPGFVEIKAVGPGDGKGLDAAEKASIDWVLENIGWMSASEISTFSHEEKAYRFTRQGENIAYEYVKFFRKLPEK